MKPSEQFVSIRIPLTVAVKSKGLFRKCFGVDNFYYKTLKGKIDRYYKEKKNGRF